MSNIDKIRKWAVSKFPELTFISNNENEFVFSFGPKNQMKIRDNGDGSFFFKEFDGTVNDSVSIQDLGTKVFKSYNEFRAKSQNDIQRDTMDTNRQSMVALPTFQEFLKNTNNEIEDYCRAAIEGTIKTKPEQLLDIIKNIDKESKDQIENPENWIFEKKESRADIGDFFFDYIFGCPACDLSKWMIQYIQDMLKNAMKTGGAQVVALKESNPVIKAKVTINTNDLNVYEVVFGIIQDDGFRKYI